MRGLLFENQIVDIIVEMICKKKIMITIMLMKYVTVYGMNKDT